MLVHENFCTFCVDSQFHILIWMMAVCMPSTDNLASVLRLLFRWMLRYFRHQTVRLQCNALWCPIVHTSVILVIGYTCMILCFDFFLLWSFLAMGGAQDVFIAFCEFFQFSYWASFTNIFLQNLYCRLE